MRTERFERKDERSSNMLKVRADYFADWTEFIDTASTVPADGPGSRASRDNGEWFTNGANWDRSIGLARDGWSDGAERVRAMAARVGMTVQARMLRKEPRFTHRRGMLMKSRYAQGNPRPMVRMEQVETIDERAGKKVLKIVVNMSASGSIRSEVIETRGAAVAALIDALERSGRRVELDFVSGTNSSGGHARRGFDIWVRVKNAGDRLNLENVVFAIAHPATDRRFGFALCESLPAADRAGIWPGSYGVPCEVEHDADIYIGRMFGRELQWQTEQGATDWVSQQLATQGIKIETAA